MRACAGRALLGILICSWLCIAGATVAAAEPRVALVIGNSDYGGDLVADPKLALRQIAEADFFLGEAAYSSGDRPEAEKWLGQAAGAQQTHALTPDILAYAAAKALLAKMARE